MSAGADRAIEIRVGLAAAKNLGPMTIRALLEKCGGEEALVAAARAGDSAVGAQHIERVAGARERGARILEECASKGIRVLLRGEPEWPNSLACLGDEPEALFVRGRVEVFSEPSVAIVGSRECTAEGANFTEHLARRLAEEGWATVSGLARGIDAAAHRGSLAEGGDTIAVLGCGVDVTYPEENRALQERIAREGVLVGEFAPGMPPIPGHFPRRNRLLAALGRAVVLVECRLRSGALVTCRHAIEHGRELYVVPGWPTSPLASGPLRLLRDGARLIRGGDDLLEDLGGVSGGPRVDAHEIEAVSTVDDISARDLAARRELLGDAAPARSLRGV